MLVSRWFAVASAAAALTIGSGAMAVNALGDHGGGGGDSGRQGDQGGHNGRSQLQGSLVPSLTSDPTLHGVMPGAHNWTLNRSELRVRGDGRIDLRVRGLLLEGQTNPGPVTLPSRQCYPWAPT